MGYKQEWENFKKLWSESSLFFKFLAVIGFLITFSSITSLSDVIFKWKGFILDGVNFYREWIIYPLQSFMEMRDIIWSQSETDAIILLGINAFMFCRGILLFVPTLWRRSVVITFVTQLGMLVIFAVVISISDFKGWQYIVFFAMIVGALSLIAKSSVFRNHDLINFFKPIIYPLPLVLILGAINAGLVR